MEKDRTIIAIILSMVVILLYFQYFAPKSQPKPKPAEQEEEQKQPVETAGKEPEKPVEHPKETAPEQPDDKEPEIVEEPPEQVEPESGSVRTDNLIVRWSNSSAALTEITLTAREDERYLYPDHTRERPLRLLFSKGDEDFVLRLCADDSTADIASGNWHVSRDESDSRKLVMWTDITAADRNKLRITKTFLFEEDSYHLTLDIRVENLATDGSVAWSYRLLGVSGIVEEADTRTTGGSLVAHRFEKSLDIARKTPRSLTDKEPRKEYSAGGAWAGLENKYFAAIVAPADNMTGGAIQSIVVERISKPGKAPPPGSEEPVLMNMRVILASNKLEIKAGAENALTHRYLLFVGPKQGDVVGRARYNELGFENLLDFGRFGFLSKLFLWVMRGVYYIIPNWGIAIIILTLIVRVCLHPVSRKSQMSMQRYQKAMQKLKPKLDKLKEKHKGNRQKLNTETMKLFKEEGVSMLPAGGCLLMFLQIPVFIGLYWALSLSIELRQAGFVFWIDDLSRPDAAFTLPGNIPLLGTPFINILPIIMLGAMIFQQKSQPRPQDAQQASQQKMTMYIMMIVIGYIFYNMPSGLVLYFLTSTLVGIAESRYIRRKLAAEDQGK
jgi:YidC/Oxa1 family membrane protein insertase